MKMITLKCTNPHFTDVLNRSKKAELRLNDRDFQVNDVMILREFDQYQQNYFKRFIACKITHVLQYFEALDNGYVMISFDVLFVGEMDIHT